MSDYPKDAGMDIPGKLESEDELQAWLENAFEECGWTAIREVSPHSSNHRADLIVNHDRYGWIGIEAKFIGSSQGPADIAKAHHQIAQKYRGRKYINNKIDIWAVCPYIKFSRCVDKPDGGDEYRRETHSFERRKVDKILSMRPIFTQSGIGWMNLNHYALSIQFIQADSAGRIPVGKLAQTDKVQYNKDEYRDYVERWRESVDIERIQDWAAEKNSTMHYGRPDAVRTAEEACDD